MRRRDTSACDRPAIDDGLRDRLYLEERRLLETVRDSLDHSEDGQRAREYLDRVLSFPDRDAAGIIAHTVAVLSQVNQ